MKQINARTLDQLKKMLLDEKQRMLSNSKKSKENNELALSPDDLPDQTDLAAHEVNQNLVFRLRDKERKLLNKIDRALGRLEDGTINTCIECEDAIGVKRLQVRPFSTTCINCAESAEHRKRVYA